VQGLVTQVREGAEGSRSVLRFVLVAADASRHPVEIRGDQIRGFVNDGDVVRVESLPWVVPPDGVLRPQRLHNLTTASRVEAKQRTLPLRVLSSLPALIGSAFVGAAVTALINVLISSPDSGSVHSVAPGPEAPDALPYIAPNPALWALLVSVPLLALALRKKRRNADLPIAVLVGLTLGVAVTIGIDI
jgi:hypothetical protein